MIDQWTLAICKLDLFARLRMRLGDLFHIEGVELPEKSNRCSVWRFWLVYLILFPVSDAPELLDLPVVGMWGSRAQTSYMHSKVGKPHLGDAPLKINKHFARSLLHHLLPLNLIKVKVNFVFRCASGFLGTPGQDVYEP